MKNLIKKLKKNNIELKNVVLTELNEVDTHVYINQDFGHCKEYVYNEINKTFKPYFAYRIQNTNISKL